METRKGAETMVSSDEEMKAGFPSDLPFDADDSGEAEVIKIRNGNKVLRKLRDMEEWMNRKMKFEAMGVERIPEDKRQPPQTLNVSCHA